MELHLLETNPSQYSTNSMTMANEMAKYHCNLQKHDTMLHSPERILATDTLLLRMPHISEPHHNMLNAPLTYKEIESALMSSPNEKVAGTNGIPTDLYKEIHKLYKQNANEKKPCLDIIALLRTAYNNIVANGITTPNFQDGWLCPLYKKSDCCEIPNYQPIMVLNSEYKILTTAIMTRLAEVAPGLIHKPKQLSLKAKVSLTKLTL